MCASSTAGAAPAAWDTSIPYGSVWLRSPLCACFPSSFLLRHLGGSSGTFPAAYVGDLARDARLEPSPCLSKAFQGVNQLKDRSAPVPSPPPPNFSMYISSVAYFKHTHTLKKNTFICLLLLKPWKLTINRRVRQIVLEFNFSVTGLPGKEDQKK